MLLLQNTYTTVEHCLVECSHVEVQTLVDHGSQPRLRRVQVAVGAIRVDLESISTTKLFHRRVLKKLDHLSFSERCFFLQNGLGFSNIVISEVDTNQVGRGGPALVDDEVAVNKQGDCVLRVQLENK